MIAETFEVFDRRALAALLERDVPRARAADYFSKKTASVDAGADEAFARWDAYFSRFAKLTDARCLCCSESLCCPFGTGLFGGFEWGLANGEGHCRYCYYPMRGHHNIEGFGKIRNLFLAYHPSTLCFAADQNIFPSKGLSPP